MKRLFYVSMTTGLLICAVTTRAQNTPIKKKATTTTTTTISKTTTPVRTAPAPAAKAVKPIADNPLNFGLNLEPALPLGDLKLASNFGFGVNGMVKYKLGDKLALRGSLGYMTFLGKTVTFAEDDGNGNVQTVSFKPAALHAVTVKPGISYMLTDNFFVQGNVGLAFLNQGGGTAFLYTPGIGYAAGHVELLFKYEGWAKSGQTLSFLGLQVGYMF